MSADMKAATEFAQTLTTSGHPDLNETVNLAAAFIELQAELNQERKAREEAERDTTWQDHADYWKKRAESAEARLAETARRKP